ncbi:MAG: RtcB family protein [Phenylobacterium sp.]
MHIINGRHNNKIIKIWVNDVANVEESALNQLKDVADLDFVAPYVAAMPDVHAGIGATIGSVIPTTKAIIPSAVGVDIGCGVNACKTNLKREDLTEEQLKYIYKFIKSTIPTGVGENFNINTLPTMVSNEWIKLEDEIVDIVFSNLCKPFSEFFKRTFFNEMGEWEKHPKYQLGTLGSGNHFIELCYDEDDCLWLLVHSGSRNIGNKCGDFFIKLAKQLAEQWMIKLPTPYLAYLPVGTKEFDCYMKVAQWCQKYAAVNRQLMIDLIIDDWNRIVDKLPNIEKTLDISCHHNYVSLENFKGKNLYICRKGAISARKGQLGIIPGSMGTRSYIIEGLGNEESFCSASHGAGRTMSRSAARKSITLEQHKKSTDGIICDKTNAILDESPAAYKDIDDVMAAQTDLVATLNVLAQLVNVKG